MCSCANERGKCASEPVKGGEAGEGEEDEDEEIGEA
jgi:hypothetical protein